MSVPLVVCIFSGLAHDVRGFSKLVGDWYRENSYGQSSITPLFSVGEVALSGHCHVHNEFGVQK